LRKGWRVVDRGVDGSAFLWKKVATDDYIMIDVFNADTTNHCYPVVVLPSDPYKNEDGKGRIIGRGCASDSKGSWIDAYNRARGIAEHYMKRN
jgi:hypothetical protein